MLGRFLELALVVDDPGAAWLRYQQQGFATAETGDVWNHAYGVVACRGFALGLHARGDEDFSIVFVKPDVRALHRDLVERGVKIEKAQLANDVFNELSLREPGGKLVRVLEARSFSPPPELPEETELGTFQSLSMPCRNLTKAREFWEHLGFTAEETKEPWEGFTLPGTPLACHAHRAMPEPALIFRSATASSEYSVQHTDEDLAIVMLGL
jgi:hypothetical protein